jgi:hypothetical protein
VGLAVGQDQEREGDLGKLVFWIRIVSGVNRITNPEMSIDTDACFDVCLLKSGRHSIFRDNLTP